MATNNKTYTISGTVHAQETNRPLTGLLVKAFDADQLSEDDYLGDAVTDEQGHFVIRYREADFVNNIVEIFFKNRPYPFFHTYTDFVKSILQFYAEIVTESLEAFFEGGPDIVLQVYDYAGNKVLTTPKRSGARRFEEYSVRIAAKGYALSLSAAHAPIGLMLTQSQQRETMAAMGITTLVALARMNIERVVSDPKAQEAGITVGDLKRLKAKARIVTRRDTSSLTPWEARQLEEAAVEDAKKAQAAYKALARVFPTDVSFVLSSIGVPDITTLLGWDNAKFRDTLRGANIDQRTILMESRRFKRLKEMEKAGHGVVDLDGLTLDLHGTAVITDEDRAPLTAAGIATLEDWAIGRGEAKVSPETGHTLDGLTRLRAIGIWGDDAIKLVNAALDSAVSLAQLSDAQAEKAASEAGLEWEKVRVARDAARDHLWDVHHFVGETYKSGARLPEWKKPQWPELPRLIGVDSQMECADCPAERSAYSPFAYFMYLVSSTGLALSELEAILHQDLAKLSPESDRMPVAQIVLCVNVLFRAYPGAGREEFLPYVRAQIASYLLFIRTSIHDIAQQLTETTAFSGKSTQEVESLLQDLVSLPADSPEQPTLTDSQVDEMVFLCLDKLGRQIYQEVKDDEDFEGRSDAEIWEEVQRREEALIEPHEIRNYVHRRAVYKARSNLTDRELFEKYFIETNLDPCVAITPLSQAIRSLQAYIDDMRTSATQPSDYRYLTYEAWRAECMGDLYPELRALWRDDVLTGEAEPWDRGSIQLDRARKRDALKEQLASVREAIEKASVRTRGSREETPFTETLYKAYFDQGLSLIGEVLKTDDDVQDAIGYLDTDEPGLALAKLQDALNALDVVASRAFFPTSPWVAQDLAEQRSYDGLLVLPPFQRKLRLIVLATELFYGEKAIYTSLSTTVGEQIAHDLADGLVISLDSWLYNASAYRTSAGRIVKTPVPDGDQRTVRHCRYDHGQNLKDYTFKCVFQAWGSPGSTVFEQGVTQGGAYDKERIGIGILFDNDNHGLRLVVRSRVVSVEGYEEGDAVPDVRHDLVLERVTPGQSEGIDKFEGINQLSAGISYTLSLTASGSTVAGHLTYDAGYGQRNFTVFSLVANRPENGTFAIIASETISARFGPLSIRAVPMHGVPPFFAACRERLSRDTLSSAEVYRKRLYALGPMACELAEKPLISENLPYQTEQELRDTEHELVFPFGSRTVWLDALDGVLDACLALTFYLRYAVIPVRMAQAHLLSGGYARAVDLLHLLYDDTASDEPKSHSPGFEDNRLVYPGLSTPRERFEVDVGPDARLMRLRLGEVYLSWARWLLNSDTDESRYQARLLCERVLKLHEVEDYCACSETIGEVTRWIHMLVAGHKSVQQRTAMDDAKALLAGLSQARRESVDLRNLVDAMLSAAGGRDKPAPADAMRKAVHELDRQIADHRDRVGSVATYRNILDMASKLAREAEVDMAAFGSGGSRGVAAEPGRSIDVPWSPNPPKGKADDVVVLPFFPSYILCVPTNPLVREQSEAACLMLELLSGCRNALGFRNDLVPELRFESVVQLASRFADMAYAAERDLLNFRQSFEQDAYSLMQAQSSLALDEGDVRLGTMGMELASSDVTLATLQQSQATTALDHYEALIATGLSEHERSALQAMEMSVGISALMAPIAIGLGATGALATATGVLAPIGVPLMIAGGVAAAGAAASGLLKETSQLASLHASYERREEEWRFQSNQARWSSAIADQNVLQALQRYSIALERQAIAEMRRGFAADAVQFLSHKFLNGAMWVWMLRCIREQYRTRLGYAIATSYLAERALAFEQQNPALRVIRFDYYDPKRDGLLGATQLQTDIVTLQNLKLTSAKRKLQLAKTISLRATMPAEFQTFRTGHGRLAFSTLMEWFDRDFPGHYLRLIKHVKVTVLALVPPMEGIHATLTNSGLSRVVVAPPYAQAFQETTVRRNPESIALSAAYQASGLFVLDYRDDLLLPFEGSGVATDWIFELPKASNQFNYDTIADVLITVEYTALDSADYRRQVIQGLGTTVSMDRAFSLRHDFPDPWYHLHNPGPGPAANYPELAVSFDIKRGDLRQNIGDTKIQQVALYFAMREGLTFTTPIRLSFDESGQQHEHELSGQPVNNVLSTRTAGIEFSGIDHSPFGQWTLALPDTDAMRAQLKAGEIQDILLVITFQGDTPPWSQ